MNSLDTGSENMPDEEIMKIIRGELPYLKEDFGVKKSAYLALLPEEMREAIAM